MPLLSERRMARINRAVRSGRILPYLAFVTFAITLLAAVVVRVFARDDFSSFGKAVWWAAQTVTTVGYGDVIPESVFGRVIAVLVMLFGIAAVSLTTAVVTSAVMASSQRPAAAGSEEDPLREVLERIERRLEQLEKRLL